MEKDVRYTEKSIEHDCLLQHNFHKHADFVKLRVIIIIIIFFLISVLYISQYKSLCQNASSKTHGLKF